MSEDADQPKDAETPGTPKVHTATLSEPKPKTQDKPNDKPAKAKKKQKPEPTTAMGKLWYNWVKPIGSVIVIVVAFRSMLLDWNDVPTGSMEPEIHVGDRIAVNRLAYGLQFPLTGPQIGIPFTPIQFDNPLDGIPQIGWGSGPQRGDIVTFWNPVTDIRMVKRIVAIPGDTISMAGGVITINGQTATHTDLDPVTEGLPTKTKWQITNALGKKDYDDAEVSYRSESLLGLTRTVQHIPERWITNAQIIELGTKERLIAHNGQIVRTHPRTGRPVRVPLEAYLTEVGITHRVIATLEQGAIQIDGEPASYNDLAKVMLAKFQQTNYAELLNAFGLSISGHKLLLDGQEVSLDAFENKVKKQADGDITPLGDEYITVFHELEQTLKLLGSTTMTNFGPITLDQNEYYMIGDNRNNSHDSRRFGPVMGSEITGKAFGVAFSFEDNKMFTLPPDPAWGRFFKDLD